MVNTNAKRSNVFFLVLVMIALFGMLGINQVKNRSGAGINIDDAPLATTLVIKKIMSIITK